MDDDIVQKINKLADEEHHLEREHGDRPLNDEERERLDAVKVSLDQCWDLLRQRRARRESGLESRRRRGPQRSHRRGLPAVTDADGPSTLDADGAGGGPQVDVPIDRVLVDTGELVARRTTGSPPRRRSLRVVRPTTHRSTPTSHARHATPTRWRAARASAHDPWRSRRAPGRPPGCRRSTGWSTSNPPAQRRELDGTPPR